MCRILSPVFSIWTLVTLCLLLTACDRRIYVRDGVTDGDRFSLPFLVGADNDPVTTSWIAYSLDRSFCQLENGDANPARYTSFECELGARQSLVQRWREIGGDAVAGVADAQAEYLDALQRADADGFLSEYVWHYLQHKRWQQPADLRLQAFSQWRAVNLPTRHRAQTRIVGSWGYVPTDESD